VTRVTAIPARPVVLRSGVVIGDPVPIVRRYLEPRWQFDVGDPARAAEFGQPDLRLANRLGARISAAQIAAILDRRPAIEEALRDIAPGASLAEAARGAGAATAAGAVSWPALRRLFDAFADIKGVGFAKMTKALHPKRAALIPMLDSWIQKYLADDDPGGDAAFGERALEMTRGYQRDLDRNLPALRAIRQDLSVSGDELTEVRILDLLILAAMAAA
jgi:hypothetical protein